MKKFAPSKNQSKASFAEPIPVGEASEVDPDSAWAMWEDSVAFQDSQMPTFETIAPLALNSASNTSKGMPDHDEIDPFASVTRNSG